MQYQSVQKLSMKRLKQIKRRANRSSNLYRRTAAKMRGSLI